MVIGNGMMATVFREYDSSKDILVFASGVSHSKSRDQQAFKREEDLLHQCMSLHQEMTFVYFSTISMHDPAEIQSPYVQHKRNMEALIRLHKGKCFIFRLPQLVGRSQNPHTLMNFLVHAITTGTHFMLWRHAMRNVLDVEDAYRIIQHIINQSSQDEAFPMEIINPASYTVKQIVDVIEMHFKRKGNYTECEQGAAYYLDNSFVSQIVQELKLRFDEDYLSRLLVKYYQSY